MNVKDQPALRYLLFLVTGIVIAMIIQIPLLLVVLLTIIAVLLLIIIKKERFYQILCASCILLCGVLSMSFAESRYQIIHDIPEGKRDCELIVLKQKSNPYYLESYIIKTKVNGYTIKGTLYAKTGMTELIPGKKYHVPGIELSSITADKNIYVFNYLEYAKVHGLSHRFKMTKNASIEDLGISNPLIYYSFCVRNDISVRFLSVLGIEKGSLVNGLLLGLKSEIPPCIADLFRQLGVSHLLAVSGLHVGLIMLIIYQILLAMSIPRIPRVILVGVFLLFYCFLTGGSPSVIRSSLMSVLLLFAPVFSRKYQALNAVAAAGVVLLLINPFYIKDLGFQFSFSAVFGILIAYPRIRAWFGKKKFNPVTGYIIDMLSVSLSAALFTTPVALYYFNSLQLASMLLNLIVIPLTFCVMISAIISLPGLFIPSIFADLALHTLDLSLNIFRWVLRLASRSSLWTVQVSSFWKPLVLGAFIVVLAFLCLENKRWRRVISLAGTLACMIWFYSSTKPELIRPELKKGNTLLYRKGRNALVINTGSAYYNNNDFDRYIKPVLEHWGIKNIDVILSQWDKGYSSNIGALQRQYPQSRVFAPEAPDNIDCNFTTLKQDTTIYWTGGKVNIIFKNKMPSIEYKISKHIINFDNETLKIDGKNSMEFYRILKGKHLKKGDNSSKL